MSNPLSRPIKMTMLGGVLLASLGMGPAAMGLPRAQGDDLLKPAAPAQVPLTIKLDSESRSAPTVEQSQEGTRHLLILSGLPGDAEHQARFAESIDKTVLGLTSSFAFDPEHIRVLFADQAAIEAGEAVPQPCHGPCTLESIHHEVEQLRRHLAPEDTLWVIALGHSHFDGLRTWFNVSGDDPNEASFAELFKDITCRRQVYWITFPASGFYIRPLSAPNRIIISATEPDREINETNFPHHLANVLSELPPLKDFDLDGDGTPTLFDLYLKVTQRVMQEYADANLLSTEHARLEDNGDGRGRGMQIDFLPEALGGKLKEGEPPPPFGSLQNLDGAKARQYVFPKDIFPEPPAEPTGPDGADQGTPPGN